MNAVLAQSGSAPRAQENLKLQLVVSGPKCVEWYQDFLSELPNLAAERRVSTQDVDPRIERLALGDAAAIVGEFVAQLELVVQRHVAHQRRKPVCAIRIRSKAIM